MATGDKLVTLDGLKSVYDTTSDMIALDYADLTFPIKKGDFCKNGGILYRANVDIPSAESWTAAHWESKALGNALAGDIRDLKSAIDQDAIDNLLQVENIFGTTQSIVFDSAGNVQSITHKDGSNNTVRTDVFTFAANSIMETRTILTGESLTIVTNLTTLETTITYAAA